MENPVVITIVRQTGDFGRLPLDRRKTPSPILIGDYRIFLDRGPLIAFVDYQKETCCMRSKLSPNWRTDRGAREGRQETL